MKKLTYLLTMFILIMMAGCAPSPAGQANQGGKAGVSKKPLNGLTRELPGSYEASFVVEFKGARSWSYTLTSRETPDLSELSLHLEGVDGPDNPGDVRMVTDGKTSWMTGQGTDNQCMLFPNGEGLDPQWIFPESLISFENLSQFVTASGEENVSGRAALHYTGSKNTVGSWKNVKVEIWQDTENRGILRFNLVSQVDDPFFKSGSGQLSAHYEVSNSGKINIEPVQGCEIPAPLPDNASHYVRLPGLASFNSTLGSSDMQRFYQQRLPKEGWAEKDVPAMVDDSIVLSYIRGTEEVEIHILSGENGGSQVKLMFMQAQ